MKTNRMDMITDGIKDRVTGIVGEAKKQFKGANPYRKEPVSPKEALLKYSEFTPEVEAMMRQSIGDVPVDIYITKMEDIKRRYQDARI